MTLTCGNTEIYSKVCKSIRWRTGAVESHPVSIVEQFQFVKTLKFVILCINSKTERRYVVCVQRVPNVQQITEVIAC
jgi:hypothetical protein